MQQKANDQYGLSSKEKNRLDRVVQVHERKVTLGKAAEDLEISVRQMRRLYKRWLETGPQGLTHQLRGKPSPRRIPEKIWEEILELRQAHYSDLGPVQFSKKLAERHQIDVSAESIRTWLKASALSYPSRSRRRRIRIVPPQK